MSYIRSTQLSEQVNYFDLLLWIVRMKEGKQELGINKEKNIFKLSLEHGRRYDKERDIALYELEN